MAPCVIPGARTTRVIENQLDVPHVPFVHHNTHRPGVGTVIDGPWVEWQDPDRFFVFMHARPEDGTPPRKPDEMPRPDKTFHLDFIFPNLWQNYISDCCAGGHRLCARGSTRTP